AGEHGRVDVQLGGRVEGRRELAGGQRPTASGEVVAGRAVEAEQLAAARGVVAAQGEALRVRPRRAAAVGLDERPERVDVARALLGLRVELGHRGLALRL